ncbi:unnamed protein product [Pedinophyceae sp. YPF-701]|nr:unnamed protein product [Pedinophyceae sp. YPF-701]
MAPTLGALACRLAQRGHARAPAAQGRPHSLLSSPRARRAPAPANRRASLCPKAIAQGRDDDDSQPFQPSTPLKYRRVMLKVSGEALQGSKGHGVDPEVLGAVAKEICAAHLAGVQVAVVVGGGNYFRGASSAWAGLDRASADYVGMLATVMNAVCLQSAIESMGVPCRVQTALDIKDVAEPYIRRRAIRHLERGRVVIFGAGTGNPFFTTDTAAALRAAEINAEALLKATKVDGVYDKDPVEHPDARRYERLPYRTVSQENIGVMDETAVTLCKENGIPVVVFDLYRDGNITKACRGGTVGTTVSDDPEVVMVDGEGSQGAGVGEGCGDAGGRANRRA